jgi:hypothetical protein
LLQLIGVRLDDQRPTFPVVVRQIDNDFLIQRSPHQFSRVADKLGHRRALPGQGRLASEGQQLSRQPGRALRQQQDVLQEIAQGWTNIRLTETEGGIAVDAGQQVIELVGHTAGQCADALHLLRLQQRPLQLLVLRDVALNADEMRHSPLAIDDRRDGQRCLKQRTVLAAIG